MDENIKYELAEAEKLEVIDNAGVAENEKKAKEEQQESASEDKDGEA